MKTTTIFKGGLLLTTLTLLINISTGRELALLISNGLNVFLFFVIIYILKGFDL